MKPTRKLVTWAALISATSFAIAQDRPLTPRDVADSWVEKTAIGATGSGARVELRLKADGSASVVAGSTSDTGTWRLSETGFCTTWKTIRSGQERCFTGTIQGTAVRVFNPDGLYAGQYTEFK